MVDITLFNYRVSYMFGGAGFLPSTVLGGVHTTTVIVTSLQTHIKNYPKMMIGR